MKLVHARPLEVVGVALCPTMDLIAFISSDKHLSVYVCGALFQQCLLSRTLTPCIMRSARYLGKSFSITQ